MLGSTSTWSNTSHLDVVITRACDPNQPEPNYALYLEVANHINSKKANTPREAAMLIANLVNHRNPHVGILALALLDTLVQSCGYPFHLQISTKEFLNELVRRFPERPPPFPGPVMTRILDLIHGWKEGICMDSRWKEDFGNIRDMHRLLIFKGYRFREVPRTPSLASASNLKSADELEEEDRMAQSAKLQELIRRGTPRDLAAAQELMKSLAGANPDAKPDYRSQALSDLNRLEQKVVLLNEMLDNADPQKGEKFVSGDVYDQVSSILITARPKLQKWISDAESDDPKSLDALLQVNDQINAVVARYEAFKRGDFVTSSNPIPAEYGPQSSRQNNNNNISLIDFDDPSQPPGSSEGSGVDSLAGLFDSITPTPAHTSAAAAPSPALFQPSIFPPIPGTATAATPMPPTFAPTPTLPSNGFGGSGSQLGAIMLPGTPQPSTGSAAGAGKTMASTEVVSGAGTPMMSQKPPAQPYASPPQGKNQGQSKDPFSDLVGLF